MHSINRTLVPIKLHNYLEIMELQNEEWITLTSSLLIICGVFLFNFNFRQIDLMVKTLQHNSEWAWWRWTKWISCYSWYNSKLLTHLSFLPSIFLYFLPSSGVLSRTMRLSCPCNSLKNGRILTSYSVLLCRSTRMVLWSDVSSTSWTNQELPIVR